MLFVLTGEVQIGKTRWLGRLVEELAERGVVSYGVLAPGIWVASETSQADAQGFEKLGIENLLLPDGCRIPFATRSNLVAEGAAAPSAFQSERAGLGWRISDDALAQVNAHFRELPPLIDVANKPGLLVVDELGRLELVHGGGLVDAMALLGRGAQPELPHALVVARHTLADQVIHRFEERWGGSLLVHPDELSRNAVISAFR